MWKQGHVEIASRTGDTWRQLGEDCGGRGVMFLKHNFTACFF